MVFFQSFLSTVSPQRRMLAAWCHRPMLSRLFSSLISQRGQGVIPLLPTYLGDARSVEVYHPETAPHGSLQLGVAENKMVQDLLCLALTEFSKSTSTFAPEWIYYQPTPGRPDIRLAMAHYLERLLELPRDRLSDNVDGVIVGAGCNAVLENLCMTLADPGQAVLIPTPYYAAFEFDLVARAGLSVVPVTTWDHHDMDSSDPSSGYIPLHAYYPNRSALDAAYQRAMAQGTAPRILLISHPQNPLGIYYPPAVIQECINWCQEREIHLISDEIYAGSVYRTDGGQSFQSILKHSTELGPYVHFVYALSKDLALSGLRIGVCYSENEPVCMATQKLNDLCQISSQTQALVKTMVTAKTKEGAENDGPFWTDAFREEHCRRLEQRASLLEACLDECGISYLKPTAGLFLWIDMRHCLQGGITESDFYRELIHDYGLLLTPGLSMRTESGGFFRCVFTAVETDNEFQLCLERLRQLASKYYE